MRRLLLFLALLVPCAGWSAEKKKWEALTNCRYAANVSNDGDSFRVKCGERELQVRLYFVDVPEANMAYPERNRDQAQHFGVTNEDVLRGGARAREYVRDVLQAPFIVHTRRSVAPGRGAGARYYAMVEVHGAMLDALLVSRGLAWNKGAVTPLPGGMASKAYRQTLVRLENEARRDRRGLWATSTRK